MHPIRPDGKPHHPEDGWQEEGAPLSFAVAPRVNVQAYSKVHAMPWARLIRDHVEFPAKDAAPLWSPVILSDMARRSASVTHLTALVYDFDHGESWDDVIPVPNLFKLRYWAYSTFSHTEEAHRFRLVLAVDEAIPANLYPKVWRGFAKMIGWHVDEACKDLARLYYVPSCPPGALAWQDWGEGSGIDWRAWLEVWETMEEANQEPPADPVASRSVRRARSLDLELEVTRRVAARILQEVPPSCSMPTWWAICCGVTDALGREGFEMVRTWSQGCPDKFNSREWKSMERRFNV